MRRAKENKTTALVKTLFKLLLLIGLIVYLVFAFTHFTGESYGTKCVGMNIAVTDSARAAFMTSTDVEHILRKARYYPIGQEMNAINSRKIETLLIKNPFIKEATCYKTPDGRLNILIAQRLPLMRVIRNNGMNCYVDEHGFMMKPMGYAADLVVVTGFADPAFIRKHLIPLGIFLRDNELWDKQIEQINVSEDHKLTLIPRLGDQIILFGSPDNIAQKFNNLRAFYEKVMPKVGWNKYSRINLENTNQIVCTKRTANKK